MNKIADGWNDYECLYAGDGQKIERWKDVFLQRPDPLAIWPLPKVSVEVAATYHRSNRGGGNWQYHQKVPSSWTVDYNQLRFKIATLGFKHTGVFPEQAANWQQLSALINSSGKKDFKVLNLFAYTGGATLTCAAAASSEVVHVDASKGMVAWAKENVMLSGLQSKRIRFIVDDCLKFIQKEQRRNRRYHGIIMDPPSYGRGPNNEIWKFEEQITYLINETAKLLADDAVFFLVNTYTGGYSDTVLNNILLSSDLKKYNFNEITCGELLLPITHQEILLPGGLYGLACKS